MDPRIKSALARSIELGEFEIDVSAYHRDKKIVDAYVGEVDKDKSSPVTRNTTFPIFSVTRGVTVLAVRIQADRGLIDVQEPIANYWPEFEVDRKEEVTVEMALSHRAGIPQMPQDMVERIAEFKPFFTPGIANAHQVLDRSTHRLLDIFVREEICELLSIEDFYLGVPDEELYRAAGHGPGTGAIADARSVARILPLITNERAEGLTRPRTNADDPDQILPIPIGQPNASDPLVSNHHDIVYSPRSGGSLAFADILDNLAVAICHNDMDSVLVLEPERIFAPIMKEIRETVADRV
ncbi:Beta-lactamase domain-containing protein 2-like protein 1 [Paraphaeosphaeria sporulosa]